MSALQAKRQPIRAIGLTRQTLLGAIPFLFLPLLVGILHFCCLEQYGFFRDELYYLSCADRLAWGYVDHPPLCVFVLKAFTWLFGPELWAVRLPAVLSAMGCVVLTGLIARALEGKLFAQTLAALCAAMAPVYMVVGHLYSMNSLDLVLWPAAILLFVHLLKGKGQSLGMWLGLGAVLGLALLNKHSAVWLIGGLLAGTLMTPYRSLFRERGFWLCAGLAALIALPNLIWQMEHGWATKEFLANAAREKMVAQPAWQFLAVQIVVMGPVTLPIWVAGIIYGISDRKGIKQPLALAFFAILILLCIIGRARPNYLAPAFPMVFAIGALVAERILPDRNRGSVEVGVLASVALVGAVIAPLALPVLPIETLERVIKQIGVEVPADEVGERRAVQGYADMFGWPEVAEAAGRAAQRLTPDQRAAAITLAPTYGEAAALEHFGPDHAVPTPASGHNAFWHWRPRDWDGSVAILIDPRPATLEMFERTQPVGMVEAPNAVPSLDGAPIFLAYNLRTSPEEFWASIRRFI